MLFEYQTGISLRKLETKSTTLMRFSYVGTFSYILNIKMK